MNLRYYDVRRNWSKKIAPLLDEPEIADVLVRDFNKFTVGRFGKRFHKGQAPFEFESCDWWLSHRGPRPKFWDYVKHSACHWLVNFNLKLAERVAPKKPWRILSSDFHSTVYDGTGVLFDMNYLALGVSPEDSYKAATKGKCEELKPGEELKVNYVLPETPEIAKRVLEIMGEQ